MKQVTFDTFDTVGLKMISITYVETVCPCCKRTIRFVDPEYLGLSSYEKEAEHYRNLCQQLMKERYQLLNLINLTKKS